MTIDIAERRVHNGDMPETYMTPTEAAKELHVSIKRIYDLLDEHRFPGAFKVGRVWKIPIEEVTGFQYKPTGRPKKRRGRPRKIR